MVGHKGTFLGCPATAFYFPMVQVNEDIAQLLSIFLVVGYQNHGYFPLLVLAASVVAFPLMYQSCRGAFASVDSSYEKAARTLGASELYIFFRITLPLAWPGILSGVVLTFARALGEFGATLMVAGNIPGQTQTIPLAIYFAVESGDKATANTLVAIITLFCFLLILWVNRWNRKYTINSTK
jgi:ABC-type molybdate transport system permease subunit